MSGNNNSAPLFKNLPVLCLCTVVRPNIQLDLSSLDHNQIEAAFRAISVLVTGQQVFGEMMTHQKRANIVLTTVNSWSGA